MPYRILSLEEFAQYIGLDINQVQQLAKHGQLPGEKVAGKWRFRMAQVSDWLQQQMPQLPDDRLEKLERALGKSTPTTPEQPIITELLGISGIELQLPAKTRRSLLRELINLAENTGLVYDSHELREALYQREELCSTAFPGGFAIPHPRRVLPYATAEPLICLARVPAGVIFGAPGGERTDLFFLICSHDEQHHLHVLARLMRMMDQKTRQALRDSQTAQLALEILIDREQQLIT